MKKRLPILLLIVLLLGSLGFGGLYYKKYSDVNKKYQDVLANSPTEVTKRLIDKVGKLLELPKDETPSVATVEDKDKLKDQPFFASAEKGDRLLIYQGAKKAIIYRESTDKVINVGPIAIQQNTAQKVAIKVVGKAADVAAVETALTAKFGTNVAVTKVDGDANNSTVVVDVTDDGSQKDNVPAIVAALKNAAAGSLKAGDTKPTDQSVVIYAGPQ